MLTMEITEIELSTNEDSEEKKHVEKDSPMEEDKVYTELETPKKEKGKNKKKAKAAKLITLEKGDFKVECGKPVADQKEDFVAEETKHLVKEKAGVEGKKCAQKNKLEEHSATTEEPEPGTSSKRVKYPETIEKFIDSIVQSNEKLMSVLSDEYYKPMPFTKVYVGQVKNVKNLSKIILLLNQRVPLKNLSHLKRAYRKEVILFPVDHLKSQTHTSIQYYIEENMNELRDSFEYFKITDVPAMAPKIKKQHIECGRSWSCNFHPCKYLEQLFTNELFSGDEIEQHRLFMGMAFEVAVYFMKKDKQVLEPSDILNADLNATVVVDPSDNSVVAVAFDNRVTHPLQHSVMLAIDNVAKTQNGGAWDTYDIDSVNLRGIGYMDLLLHLKKKYPNIKFGAKDYMSKTKLDEQKLSASDSPYLCTGYYIYMIREPCVMCAMGLVHARIKRVFFCMKSAMGALTSLTKLHCVPSLNHHFEVFTDFL